MSSQMLSLINELGQVLDDRGGRDSDLILNDVSKLHQAMRETLIDEEFTVDLYEYPKDEFDAFYEDIKKFFADESTASLKNLYNINKLKELGEHKQAVCRALVRMSKERGDEPLACWVEGVA